MCIRLAPSRIRKIKDFFLVSLLLSVSVSYFSLYNCNEKLQTPVWWQIDHTVMAARA